MASHREGVNPLRPYYIPPSIGQPVDPISTPSPNPFQAQNATEKYASKARDIFNDLDYKDYIAEPSPSVVRTAKDLVDELLWKYTSILMSQPFEVAKTILQVRCQDDIEAMQKLQSTPMTPVTHRSTSSQSPGFGDGHESDSEGEEPAYFTSSAPDTPTPVGRSRNRSRPESPSTDAPHSPRPVPAHQLDLRRPNSIADVISQLWSKEGAWGVWKGSNATFLYNILQSLLENWTRSLLSALFNVPDLGVKDDIDKLIDIASPYPWSSLFVAGAAAVATGLLLAPLDLVRTRLLLTPAYRQPRRTLQTLRSLPSYYCPPLLVVPTILHSLVHPLVTLPTPLVLRSQFMIDREASPTTFSVARFLSSSVALFVKLPLQTVLRRGQLTVLSNQEYIRAIDKNGTMQTIVPPGRYNGVVGTMYTIITEEGSRISAIKVKALPRKGRRGPRQGIAEKVYRRGQGYKGLWRGWKVSWWGLVGLWAASLVGGGGEGEF